MEPSSVASNFDKRISVPSNLDFMTDISPDWEAVTINFRNVEIGIGPAQLLPGGGTLDQTAIQTKVVTLHIPYSTARPSVTMRMALHGRVAPVQAEVGVAVR